MVWVSNQTGWATTTSLSPCSLIGAGAGLGWLVLVFCERKTLLAGWISLAETNKRIGRISDATCSILCGMEPEDGHHAMVRCTFASALRHALRQSWNLPEDSAFTYTGPDWILALLNSANKDIRVKLMLLFWRIWHHRNDNVFWSDQCPI